MCSNCRMDPISIATIVITAVISTLTLILNIHQSIKWNHFSLTCSDCCTLETHEDVAKPEVSTKLEKL